MAFSPSSKDFDFKTEICTKCKGNGFIIEKTEVFPKTKYIKVYNNKEITCTRCNGYGYIKTNINNNE